MDEKAWAIIKAIITKGNDAVVRKKGDGYIVLEDKREIKPPRLGAEERH